MSAIVRILCIAALAAPSACASTEGLERRVTYLCDRGPDLTVVYVEGAARIEGAQGQVIVLPQRLSGSGTWYETATHSLRGKGDEVIYTVGRMAPMTCTAR